MQKHCSIQFFWIGKLLCVTLNKIPLPMRLLIIMLCVSIGCIRATNTYAQNAILDLKVNNQTIETVLKIIESRTDFVFFFNSQQVNVHKRVSINVNKQNIFKILDEVFKGSDVVYSVLDKSIILSSKRFAPDGNLKKITGKVVDTNGEPLIGVTIALKGSNRGTVSDVNGNFSLNGEEGKLNVLNISYIGYKDQQVKVEDGKTLIITLEEDTKVLEEVVVVGYGSQKKETLTGAVTVVSDKMLENKGAMSSPVQALQGQVPGVIITRSSGAPGDESWGMKLRGAVSANSTDPLIIIDGVEYESVNELRLLNSADIESINFLKDASAAIYGSKAAGGVILVTTKQAKEGKAKIEYSGSYTHKFVGLQPKMMSIDQWSEAIITTRHNDGLGDDDQWIKYAQLAQAYKGGYIDLSKNPNPIPAFGDVDDYVFMDTNWQDVLFGNAGSTQHNLSVSGGNEKSLYRLSVGYMYDDSTLKWGNNNNKRFNVRLTNTVKLTDRFTIESVMAYNRQDQVSPTMIDRVLTSSYPQPGLPSSTMDGKPYHWGGNYTPNWYAELGGDNKLKVSGINISENLKYQFTSYLDAVVNLGYNTSTATRVTER